MAWMVLSGLDLVRTAIFAMDPGVAMSLVLPQDIPLVRSGDIGFLLKFFTPPTCVLVVPSGRLGGTNTLLRCPPDIMGTHYDDDIYRSYMAMARGATSNPDGIRINL